MLNLYNTEGHKRTTGRKWQLNFMNWLWIILIFTAMWIIYFVFQSNWQEENRYPRRLAQDLGNGNTKWILNPNYKASSIFPSSYFIFLAIASLVAFACILWNQHDRKWENSKDPVVDESIYWHSPVYGLKEQAFKYALCLLCWPVAFYSLVFEKLDLSKKVELRQYTKQFGPVIAEKLVELERFQHSLIFMQDSRAKDTAQTQVAKAINFIYAARQQEQADKDAIVAANMVAELQALITPSKITLETHQELMAEYHDKDIQLKLEALPDFKIQQQLARPMHQVEVMLEVIQGHGSQCICPRCSRIRKDDKVKD